MVWRCNVSILYRSALYRMHLTTWSVVLVCLYKNIIYVILQYTLIVSSRYMHTLQCTDYIHHLIRVVHLFLELSCTMFESWSALVCFQHKFQRFLNWILRSWTWSEAKVSSIAIEEKCSPLSKVSFKSEIFTFCLRQLLN